MTYPRNMQKWIYIAASAVIICCTGLPRLMALGDFATADEDKWIDRSLEFLGAFFAKDAQGTYLVEHPGVTTMAAGAVGTWLLLHTSDTKLETGDYRAFVDSFEENNGPKKLPILKAGRFVLVISHIVILTIAFFYASRLIGILPASLGFILIAFDPFHTAHSRLLHLDGILSSLLTLSILAMLSFQESRKIIDLSVAGIAAGFSWLTKTTGFFLAPAVVLVFIYLNRNIFKAPEENVNIKLLNHSILKPLIIFMIIGTGAYYLFWPAMWMNPVETLQKVFVNTLLYAQGGHESPVFFGGVIYPEGEIGFFSWFYPVSILWRLTPITFLGILFAFISAACKFGEFSHSRIRQFLGALLIFVLVFIAILNLGEKKFDRYLLPIFPSLDMIAALGWLSISAYLANRIIKNPSYRKIILSILLITLGAGQIFTSVKTSPYYLSYYNPLFGGPKAAQQSMMIGWGEGLNEAAQYLAQKPDAEKLHVFSWYDGGPFTYFFPGRVDEIPTIAVVDAEKLHEILSGDYAVIYIHQWQRSIPQPLLETLAERTPEHSIWINGLEYARIYKLNP